MNVNHLKKNRKSSVIVLCPLGKQTKKQSTNEKIKTDG
jgi:hypothetical protein